MSSGIAEDTVESSPDLSALVIALLKGVLYRDSDTSLWTALLQLQARVRDYVSVMGLELALDESEGYAFLRSRTDTSGESLAKAPRLIARRPLSFPVSMLLALLRKKLAEFDAGAGDTRLILTQDQIVDMIRVFLADTTNEARLVDQIETHVNKIVDLGFLRRMKGSTGANAIATYEVRRILKAFVDAQWLAEFDSRLLSYKNQLANAALTAHD